MTKSELGKLLALQDFLDQRHCIFCTAERGLITKTTMAIVMNNLHTVNLIFFNARATITKRSQTNTMTNNAKPLDAFSLFDKLGANCNCPFHNSVREVRIRQCIPVVLLIGSAKDCAAT